MKIKVILLILVSAITLSSCSKDPDGPKQPKPINLPQKGQQVISASNRFGIDLFRVTAGEENGNMMLSPLSASTALTMLLNGCQSETYNQIRDMLGYGELTTQEINETYNSLVGQLLAVDPEVKLSLANAVWYKQGFNVKQDFLSVMDSSFQAAIGALDFSQPSALETINNWAKDNTNGKIPKVLDEIDPDMVMFLMNALYFKGNWTYQFKESQTSDLPFTLKDGSITDVKMMRQMLPARYFYGNNALAVELPYGQQNFAMVIILPNENLDAYIVNFGEAGWQEIVEGLDSYAEPDDIEMILPKFKFEYEKILNDQLKALGMTDAFDPFLADLSGIADADLVVDFVKQNTFVDVNEEGTEAAAVTTIGIKEVSMPPTIMIDKPFIFAIRERMTNSLLFLGKVEHPGY
ncbi:MAG: serpin family protein [Bacteroidales bacterium]|nr:serpin family protein [Bacteroidales bacterium]MDX9907184.1 serpin family protein [Bacteroidales bacterium]